ncbi:MAG TPA: N-acetylmuramoyl-L-alanine amidase, partial [Chthoniobacterales bacterium]|nr:N-acetylmuramoyl-L-alanine amidase [Chthoniobacterales bacterium]
MRLCLFFLLVLLVSADVEGRPALVVIDPGHGGYDRGGMPGQILPEKPFTLDTARRLARILKADGVKVVLTRSDDYYVS